jgi:hypothetical protein
MEIRYSYDIRGQGKRSTTKNANWVYYPFFLNQDHDSMFMSRQCAKTIPLDSRFPAKIRIIYIFVSINPPHSLNQGHIQNLQFFAFSYSPFNFYFIILFKRKSIKNFGLRQLFRLVSVSLSPPKKIMLC